MFIHPLPIQLVLRQLSYGEKRLLLSVVCVIFHHLEKNDDCTLASLCRLGFISSKFSNFIS